MKLPLYGAHGVEWDWRRECLWALGTEVLLKIEINDAKAVVVEEFKLPTPGGHDLTWWSASELVLSVDRHCYLFSVTENKFNRFLPLADEVKVKSIHRSRKTGKLVWHRGAKETWWSDTIRFAQPKENRALEGGEDFTKFVGMSHGRDHLRVRRLSTHPCSPNGVFREMGHMWNEAVLLWDLDGDGMEDTLLSGWSRGVRNNGRTMVGFIAPGRTDL